MRLLNSEFIVPAGSFLIAVGLSLGIGYVKPVLARQAAEVTACIGSATATSITVAAGSGIKKGIQGFNFAITDQPITVENSKKADLMVNDMLEVTVFDVVVTDTKNVKHPLGDQTLQVSYAPFPVYENTFAPGKWNINAIPAQVTPDRILARLKVVVAQLLPTVTVKRVTGTFKGQDTFTRQIITLFCEDGTELPVTKRPETKLTVDGKGNGGPVKN
jgi:hypothetical protein